MPDYSTTDEFEVRLALRGTIDDSRFLRFFKEVTSHFGIVLHVPDLLIIDCIRRDGSVPRHLRVRIDALVDSGIVERVSVGRYARFALSRRVWDLVGEPAAYTRGRGLDRETNKELLVRHLYNRGAKGSTLTELQKVVPNLTVSQVRRMLQELKKGGRIRLSGRTRGATWYETGAQK